MRIGLMGIAWALFLTTSANAGLLERLLEPRGTCYARHYDKEHLATHPCQQITAVYLSNSTRHDPRDKRVLLELGFALKDGESYSATAYCTADDLCSLEADGGTFQVSEAGDRLRIEVGEFLSLEGANGWSDDLAQSDDRVLLLYRTFPSACSCE